MEQITIEELPFKFGLLKSMALDGLTIERMKGEFGDYYYLTSSKIHRVYRFQDEKAMLLTEIYLTDLYHALDSNPSFRRKIETYIGN